MLQDCWFGPEKLRIAEGQGGITARTSICKKQQKRNRKGRRGEGKGENKNAWKKKKWRCCELITNS